jgi:primosomal protein N' (replication factor Y)
MLPDDSPIHPPRPPTLYADVIVPRHLAGTFTYLVPPALAPALEIGHRVLVPFGRTMVEGAVVRLNDHPPTEIATASLKEISSLTKAEGESEISALLLTLSRQIAERYVAPWGQCLRLVLSANPAPRASASRYVVTEQGRAAWEAGRCPEGLRSTLERIVRRSAGLLCSTLRQSRNPAGRQAIEALEKRSWITVVSAGGGASFSGGSRRPIGNNVSPSMFQRVTAVPGAVAEPDSPWVARIAEYLRANEARKIVLHAPWEYRVSQLAGVIREAQALNRSVLILAGEVAKAEWLTQRLSILTKTPLTLLRPSSGVAPRVPARGGVPSVVVGTRSAIFAPLRSVGLIWVDGEDDPAFKEPQEPRYHARDVAAMRAESEGALLVLASAHPSLESRMDVAAETYTVQPEAARRPSFELVDLHEEPGGTLFSGRLVLAMREAMERAAGVLLFLNRKGYAGALVCQDCGGVPRCTGCAVALTYYREASRLVCRYCGAEASLPDSCPMCRAVRLSPVGEGTERAELEARRLFPRAKIARLDGDTLRRSASARRLWAGVEAGEWDILIGTQVLFQKGPLPTRGLVGVLQADSGLHVADFRAAERTYHLLVDAVSVARPASEGGRVVLQTWLPAHHAVQAVITGVPSRFYDEELSARRLLSYPPACHLICLSVSGKESQAVEAAAQEWKRTLERSLGGQETVTILGPVSSTGGRRRGRYRYQILVKGTDQVLLCRWVQQSVQKMEEEYRRGGIKFIVDVDPVEMG